MRRNFIDFRLIFFVLCCVQIQYSTAGPLTVEWQWDKWCHLQAKSGNCKARVKLYYYDTMTAQCRQFIYTGCNGNQNQFGSLRDCDTFCQDSCTYLFLGVAFNPEERSDARSEICSLQPNTGVCALNSISRWYYNVNTRRCAEFVFSGCGGNGNRFENEGECMKFCSHALQ